MQPDPPNSSLTHIASDIFQRRVITPLLNLLRIGASPRKLAWSLAIGFAIGINPLLGSTTIAALTVAFVLRLNLLASQIANHIVYTLSYNPSLNPKVIVRG